VCCGLRFPKQRGVVSRRGDFRCSYELRRAKTLSLRGNKSS
jgi:hypothetical protein